MFPDPIGEIEISLKTGIDLSEELAEAISGLEGDTYDRFVELWRGVDSERRARLLGRLREASDENLLLDFSRVYRLGLDDVDPSVRFLALRLAAEEPDPGLLETYLNATLSDPDEEVRLSALDSLGAYTLAAQSDDWPVPIRQKLEEFLLSVLHRPGGNFATRRAALLSLSYLTTPRSEQEIRRAHLQPDLREAAVEAMGRNCQDIWLPDIVDELGSDDEDIRLTAVQASAEMEEPRLVPALMERVQDTDFDVRLAAVQALGIIGGEEAKSALAELLSSRDQDLRDAAKDAIEEILLDEDPLRVLRERDA